MKVITNFVLAAVLAAMFIGFAHIQVYIGCLIETVALLVIGLSINSDREDWEKIEFYKLTFLSPLLIGLVYAFFPNAYWIAYQSVAACIRCIA